MPDRKVVMISGAARGLGRAIATTLAAEGWQLSLGVRDPAAKGVRDARWDPERVSVFAYEARDRDAGRSWVDRTVSRFGRIDALVNNAAIGGRVTLDNDDETLLDEMLEINLKGPLRLIRAALPHLRAAGAGRVVNVSSLSGKRVASPNVGYAMTKFALVALTHAVRREGWDDGVRATVLCPSYIATDFLPGPQAISRDAMTQPEDLARIVALLLSLPNQASVAELLVNCRYEDMV